MPRTPSIPVSPVASGYRKPVPTATWQPTKTVWPSGNGDAVLPTGNAAESGLAAKAAQSRGSGGATSQAGALPVWIGAAPGADTAIPAKVHVAVAPKAAASAAGVNGVLLSVARADGGATSGAVRLTLSYAQFQDAFGADWDARLALVALPACALTTPSMEACRVQSPVRFSNDLKKHTLQADLALPAADASSAAGSNSSAALSQPSAFGSLVLAASSTTASDAGGGGGDFTATSLKASGSWQAGGSADAFTWSYPLPAPAVPGGLAPKLQLSYNSQSQDGLTSSTNNQASDVGDGWSLPESYIERSYQSCKQNPTGPTQTYDNCWSSNNTLTISLNGSTSTLVQNDNDTTNTYHPQSDSNERVQYLTGASNGAHNGEYWVVTTTDGTQYWFGQNQLPGYASGNATTNSVWTEPVYATASGQPCYSATFSSSWCQQAYRWNLDYVVDTHSDVVSYWYNTETNYYAMDKGTTAPTASAYTRGGYLWKIQYGQRAGQVYSTTSAGQITFTVNGRCNTSVTGCATSTLPSSTATWPDVPYDMNCASGASCAVQSPSFWTEYEVTGIQTQALVGSTLTNVDSWALQYAFPPTGDTTTPSLWLNSITHTGQDTSAGGSSSTLSLPLVSFTPKALANRVATGDGYPPITRPRLYTINTETGQVVTVNYSAPGCASSTPSDDTQNTMLCYPGYWTPTGKASPIKDYFNKYIVNSVSTEDPTTKDTIQTTYTPVGSPAWHYDDNPLVPTSPTNERTWDQWRGYSGMSVSTGTAPDPITKTTYTYLRGMDGDYLTSTTTRSASVTDSRSDPAVRDLNQYAGVTYETRVFNGTATVTDTISDPWTSSATASHTLTGLPTLQSFITGTADTKIYTPLASGSTRETETDYTHDAYGRVTATNDQGDVSTSTDDLCTTTSYADSASAWILDKAAATKTVSVNCSTTPSYPANAVSDNLTFYDGSTTLGAAPSVGDATMTQTAVSYTASAPNYATMSTATMDQYGRTLTATDPDQRKTTTAYTPVTGAQPTSVKVTDPMTHATTTTYDALRALPLSKTDAGGYVTSEQYDALGRLTAVYKPGISSASLTYSYTISNGAASVVDAYTLNWDGSYKLSETLYDAMLRAREVQTQTPDNGRDITDTYYNSDGWQSETTAPYFDSGAVSTTYVQAQAGKIPSATGYLYDQAGRKTAQIAYANATETWRTTYSYGGNFTTSVPPAGATATTSVSDARGRQSDLIQYHAGAATDYVNDPVSDYSDTTYTYTPAGKQATEVDAAGNSWSWMYNLLGQQTDAYDPDTGHTASTYDNAGQLLTSTDARGKQTTNAYDLDGRKTAGYDTTSTQTLSSSNQLTKYVYDSLATGYPTSTTSYSNGDTYTSAITGYNTLAKVKGTKVTLTGEGTTLVPATGYTTTYLYTLNGLLSSQSDPASGGLAAETITYSYDTFGEPIAVKGIGGYSGFYIYAAGYSEYGQPVQYTYGGSTSVTAQMTYDPQTQNLTDVQTTDSTYAGTLDDLAYTYGNAAGTVSKGSGLLTQTVDSQNAVTTVDTQCYAYDYATRIQQAWTATDHCAAIPATGNSTTVGGALAPYWQSWTYDAAGNRQTQTDHDTSGTAANDTTTTYNYPAAGSATDQPHTLTNTTATGPNAAANTATYGYDTAGNTTGITGGTLGNQTLTWNTLGKLQTDTTSAGATSYVYDASGNQIARRDPGTTTFYMGDEQLTLNTTTGTVTGVRYYSINGATIAVRNSSGQYSYLVPDRQGTDQLAVNASTLAVTRRQYTPFGTTRGTAPTWVGGDKGYIGGNNDTTTGLETLGARVYDPVNGRFLSPDPLLETTDPTQLGGYDYAGNDPVTGSDPTGKMLPPGDGDGGHGTGCGASNFIGPCYTGGGGTSAPTPQPPTSHNDTGWGFLSGFGHAVEDFFAAGNKQHEQDWFGGINSLVHGWIKGDNVDQTSDTYQTWYFTGYMTATLAPAAIPGGEASIFDSSLLDASGAGRSLTALESAGPPNRLVPDPLPQFKASGGLNRTSAVYINVRTVDGSIQTVGSRPGGFHAEDVAQGLEPGGQMSRPFGWRGDPVSGEVTWQPINVCVVCQSKFPSTLFPSGTIPDAGGAWGY